jgi:rhodanese-related sulfurtransferase
VSPGGPARPADRDALYEGFARVGHALSHPTRLRLVSLLAQGEKSVEILAERSGQPFASVSAHLKILRDARLVQTRRAGRQIIYALGGPSVEALWLALRAVAEAELPEVRELTARFTRDPATLDRLDTPALLEAVSSGQLLLLDLRPPDEYAAAHLPGARSVPLAELERRLAELPRDREVVAYCRGPYCVMAVEGVALLRRHGLPARRLLQGVPEWRAAQLPLDTQQHPR